MDLRYLNATAISAHYLATGIPTRGGNVQNVLLQLAPDGTVWVLAKCKRCGRMSRHRIADAIKSMIPCEACGHKMDISDATIQSVHRHVEDGETPV